MNRSSEQIQAEVMDYVKEGLKRGYTQSRINHTFHFLKLEQEWLDAQDREHDQLTADEMQTLIKTIRNKPSDQSLLTPTEN